MMDNARPPRVMENVAWAGRDERNWHIYVYECPECGHREKGVLGLHRECDHTYSDSRDAEKKEETE